MPCASCLHSDTLRCFHDESCPGLGCGAHGLKNCPEPGVASLNQLIAIVGMAFPLNLVPRADYDKVDVHCTIFFASLSFVFFFLGGKTYNVES